MAESSSAPKYQVPHKHIISVEHPCIIKNVEKGIDMLGGASAIKHVLEPDSNSSLALSFHPEDPDSKPILSFNNASNNILLRVTVPKRVGKRKRGSDEPSIPVNAQETKADASHLIRSLQDNPTTAKIEALGTINHTHVFRAMPDFVYSTNGDRFLSNVKSHLLPANLPSLNDFDMQHTYSQPDTSAIPPPVLSTISTPQPYTYRQPPNTGSTQPAVNSSLSTILNTKPTLLTLSSTTAIPLHPPSTLPPLSSQPPAIQKIHAALSHLYALRPIYSRRALLNALPSDLIYDKIRSVMPYLAYNIRGGPWRDCWCRYGIDPRSSHEYAEYQTIMLHMPRSQFNVGRAAVGGEFRRSTDKASHIFTGKLPVGVDGSTWQLCDVTDPQIAALIHLHPSQLRGQCETKFFGWFHNGTIAKIRTVMKAKLDILVAGEEPDAVDFVRFLAEMPDQIDAEMDPDFGSDGFGVMKGESTPLEKEMSKSYRDFCKYGVSRVVLKSGNENGVGSQPQRRNSARRAQAGPLGNSIGGDAIPHENHTPEAIEEDEGDENDAAWEWDDAPDTATPMEMDVNNDNDNPDAMIERWRAHPPAPEEPSVTGLNVVAQSTRTIFEDAWGEGG
jgi:general transcription factor 3C polypeptide 5 (transcription factor C subunit 1)